MKFKTRTNRLIAFKTIIGFIPEIIIASVATWYLKGGFLTGALIYFGIFALYFVNWAIRGIICWSWFFISQRKDMSTTLCDFLYKHKFPEPADYEDSAKGYFATLVEDEDLDSNMRILSAIELNSLTVMYNLNELQTYYMTEMAYEDAIQEYKRGFIRRSEREENY